MIIIRRELILPIFEQTIPIKTIGEECVSITNKDGVIGLSFKDGEIISTFKFKSELISQALKLTELVDKSIESNTYYESLVIPHPGHECLTTLVIETLTKLREESRK